jgi:hypothetical protein
MMLSASVLIFVALSTGLPVQANELSAGMVINNQNLEQVLNDTFEGHSIQSMLPPNIQMMIRSKGLTITLRHSEQVPVDASWLEATKQYAKDVKLDPKTGQVTGYQAGLCFPDVSMNDPNAALKLVWNAFYVGGYPRGTLQFYPNFAFLYISGDKGLDREQHWSLIRYYLKGPLTGKPVVGDGKIFFKQLLFARYPIDIAGLGTFTIRYDTGRLDDTWAYLKTVRRTRQLTGGAWMDPVDGTDMLNDDVEIFSAYPLWYPKYKLLGKQYILAVAHSRWPTWNKKEKSLAKRFPTVDLEHAPYWNVKDDWEPREVYVIEATMPSEHPYSKKILYLDAHTWVFYQSECYDKQGKLWKELIFNMLPIKTKDGQWGILSNLGDIMDFKSNHATIFLHDENSQFNPPGVKADDVSLNILEQAGAGELNWAK